MGFKAKLHAAAPDLASSVHFPNAFKDVQSFWYPHFLSNISVPSNIVMTTAGTAYAIPLPIGGSAVGFDAMGVELVTAPTGANQTFRAAVYADNGKGYPGQLLKELGTFTINIAAGAGDVITALASLFIAPPSTLCWLVIKPDNVGTTGCTLWRFGQAQPAAFLFNYGMQNFSNGFPYSTYVRPGLGTGAYPATFPTTGSTFSDGTGVPYFLLRAGVP
jgi:hypothetical protein